MIPTDIVKALLLIAKYCIQQRNCEECPLKDFCSDYPSNW